MTGLKHEYKPTFSIIIPTYNHAHYIKRCIDSLLAQSVDNWEAIIINNFSTDNTIDIIKTYKDRRLRVINFANNGIIAASRNHGIRHARADWICFLDSDDWWSNDKLFECSKYIRHTKFIYHPLVLFKQDNPTLRSIGRNIKNNIFKDLLINGNAVPNSSVVVHKSLLIKINYLSEARELVGVEDADAWLRISNITGSWKYINKKLGFYWIGNNFSVSAKQIEKEFTLLKKYLCTLDNSDKYKLYKTFCYRKARISHQLGSFDKAKAMYYKAITPCICLRNFKILFLFILAKFGQKK